MIQVILSLITCLILLNVCGCKSKESIAWEKELNRQNQEQKIAWEKDAQRKADLPTCEGTQWFEYCEPDFFLPDYQTIQVHIQSDLKEAQAYIGPIVKSALEKRGYGVFLGEKISEKEYLAIDDNYDEPYSSLPVPPKPGSTSCKINNPQYREGADSLWLKYFEVRHHKPFLSKLLLGNPEREAVDAVLFVRCSFVQDGMSQYWRVDARLFDTKRQKTTLWNRACYRSACGNGVKAFMQTKTGTQFSEVIGNKIYTSTPYWFEGNKPALLSQALNEMFAHLPERVDGKVVPRTFELNDNGTCPWRPQDVVVFE